MRMSKEYLMEKKKHSRMPHIPSKWKGVDGHGFSQAMNIPMTAVEPCV